MKTFEEIYQIVEESSHETAFNKEECQALYDTLLKLPLKAIIVEIGVEYGRSTSVIAEIGKEKDFDFTAIDNWCQANSEEAKAHVYSQKEKHQWKFKLISGDSVKEAKDFKKKINLIHIDGDHEYEAVLKDIKAWLPKVECGGFACFDDYGHDSLPGIYKATEEYMQSYAGKSWNFIGRFGNKLGIFQKI